jgi:acylphosphatase
VEGVKNFATCYNKRMLFQLNLIIHGRVQGVFFREFGCEEARRLGLVGTIQNNSDDTVSAVAQGDKSQLEKFKEWCQKGPKLASVERVEEQWQEVEKLSFDRFFCAFH